MCYMRTSVHLLTLGHILNQSCLSNVESPSFTTEHNGFRDRRCVLLLLVAEHFLKGQMHGDSDSSLVVLWWSDCLGFRLDWCSGKSTCLSGALFEQVRANLYSVTKKLNCIPKRAVYVSLSVIHCYPSSLGWTAGEIRKKEGRTELTQSLIRRAGLEVHQISPVRPWLKVSKITLLWLTWIWRITASALKGPRLGLWLRMVWSGKGPHDFIERIKTCGHLKAKCI